MPKNTDAANKTTGLLDLDEPDQGSTVEGRDAGDLESLIRSSQEWWYVDGDGNIMVRGGKYCSDRVVGKVLGEDTARVLATLVLRFGELESRFTTLTSEVKGTRNPARNLKSMYSFVHWVEGSEAIGDVDGLLERAHAVIRELEARVDNSRSTKASFRGQRPVSRQDRNTPIRSDPKKRSTRYGRRRSRVCR